jgi:flagella basal body P-ring formation protein FlgA
MRYFLWPILLIAAGVDVEGVIIKYLNQYYPVENAQYVCDISRLSPVDITGFDSVGVDGFGKDCPKGQVVVRLSYYKDGLASYKAAASVNIGILKPVIVAGRAIKPGEALDADKLGLETRNIAELSDAPIEAAEAIRGMIASHFIPAGRIITSTSIQMPPALITGDHIMIKYSRGSLTLSTEGIAKENGFIGERIKVMNADSKKIISATVIDSTTVAIGNKEEF